jgi:hypothetical protein
MPPSTLIRGLGVPGEDREVLKKQKPVGPKIKI